MRLRSTSARAFGFAAGLLTVIGLIFATAVPSGAARGTEPREVPDWVKQGGLDQPGSLAPALRGAVGPTTVSVALSERAIATTVAEGAIASKSLPSRSRQRSQTADVEAQQDRVVREARKLGARELGRASKAANVVAMRLPARNLNDLAQISGVVSIKPIARYQVHRDPGGSGSLAQAAEYLQATSVRAAGFDGTGIKIGVLDSGVDFTHAYLGGPGTVAAYEECYEGATGTAYNVAPSGACADLFGPSAPKVKGGYDFVGETWNGTPDAPTLDPDPNPIDRWGHGTHVADIAAGRSADGTHQGIAPGADVYAVKVCSAVSTACNGVAVLNGLDFVLDPNDDGDLSDAMDVVNMSLGRSYGQAEDDATVAVDNVVRAGVVVVASAGNSADRPFIAAMPSTAQRAISVAQTALPDDKVYAIKINSPTVPGIEDNLIRNAPLQSWSPAPTRTITAGLAQPSGNREGCTAAAFSGFPAGAIALVKRGSCYGSLKAQNAQAAGASAVIIWNNVPGDPPDFSFEGGPAVTVPTLTISLDNGIRLSNAVAAGPVNVSIDPATARPLRNTVVGTSSRGPSVSGIRAKPDIGAPGAWLSAEVGTGNGQTNFGGTSGAAPVVTGAAALILDRYPLASPTVVKSRLLNGASTANRTPDANADLYATPISRIGAGEVRVAPAVNAAGVLISGLAGHGNIGLGLPHLTKTETHTVRLQLSNTRSSPATYRLSPEFRDRADRVSGAVRVQTPAVVRVPARGTAEFAIRVTIDPKRLAQWPFTHAAGYTGNGAALNAPEFDGYLKAISARETLHLGWTVLPHRSADVSASASPVVNDASRMRLTNRSTVLDGRVNVFGLTGTSPRYAAPAPGQPGSPGSNLAVIDLAAAGVRDDGRDVIQFAVAAQRRYTIPLYPAGFEIDIDTDRDGDVDKAIFQQEAGGFAATGQSVVYILDVATATGAAYYYTDADFDSSTRVLSAPLSALGLSRGSKFDFYVLAYDNYFSGVITDAIGGQSWTVGAEKYAVAGSADQLVVPAGRSTQVAVRRNPAVNSSQTGLLLTYDDAVRRDAQALLLEAPSSALNRAAPVEVPAATADLLPSASP